MTAPREFKIKAKNQVWKQFRFALSANLGLGSYTLFELTVKAGLHYAFFSRAFYPRHRFLREIVPEKKFASLLNIGQATLGTMSRKTRQLANSVPILKGPSHLIISFELR